MYATEHTIKEQTHAGFYSDEQLSHKLFSIHSKIKEMNASPLIAGKKSLQSPVSLYFLVSKNVNCHSVEGKPSYSVPPSTFINTHTGSAGAIFWITVFFSSMRAMSTSVHITETEPFPSTLNEKVQFLLPLIILINLRYYLLLLPYNDHTYVRYG